MCCLQCLCSGLSDSVPHRKEVVETGTPDRAVVTTCAYCGVGCTFHAEMRGEELIGSLDAEGEDRDRRGPRSNLFKLFGCYWREVT